MSYKMNNIIYFMYLLHSCHAKSRQFMFMHISFRQYHNLYIIYKSIILYRKIYVYSSLGYLSHRYCSSPRLRVMRGRLLVSSLPASVSSSQTPHPASSSRSVGAGCPGNENNWILEGHQ